MQLKRHNCAQPLTPSYPRTKKGLVFPLLLLQKSVDEKQFPLRLSKKRTAARHTLGRVIWGAQGSSKYHVVCFPRPMASQVSVCPRKHSRLGTYIAITGPAPRWAKEHHVCLDRVGKFEEVTHDELDAVRHSVHCRIVPSQLDLVRIYINCYY